MLRHLLKSFISFNKNKLIPYNASCNLIKRNLFIKSYVYTSKFDDLTPTSVSADDEHPTEDEEVYWSKIQRSIDAETIDELKHRQFTDLNKLNVQRKVFVLQLRMQYKSKSRQSTTPELQLQESIALVETLPNWKVIDSLIIGMKKSYSREIFGSGNQERLSKIIASSGANTLFIVIDRLNLSQVKRIRETLLGNNSYMQIYDRFTIVLEIFKRNARSKLAKLQVALAEIPYMRHRYDNNELYKKVEKKLKNEIDIHTRTRNQLNTQRNKKQIPIISVFGYTNAGKTSFIKLITNDTKMKPENKLFATLDVTYHGTSLNTSNSSSSTRSSGQNVIFVDTIGFISDIPHTLIESFRTTINDALNADLYIHLIDLSHPDHVAQEKTVVELLGELAPKKKLENMLTIYNKCDKLDSIEMTKNVEMNDNVIHMSCLTQMGMQDVIAKIEAFVRKELNYINLSLLVEQGSEAFNFLNKNAIIKELKVSESDSQFIIVNAQINKQNAFKFIKLFPNVKVSK